MLSRLIIVSCILSVLSSCHSEDHADLFVGDHLKMVIKEQDYPYFKTYNKAASNDSKAIESFLLFIEQTDGEASFDHSSNIERLGKSIGNDKLIIVAKKLNSPVLDSVITSIKNNK